jgi:hypothetical protein
MKDISFIVYTNESYYDLLKLTLPHTIKNTNHLDSVIHVVSNKIPKNLNFPSVNFIDCETELMLDGGHFGNTLLKALNKIEQEYVLFLCDDYLIKSPIKKERFHNIVDVMKSLNADYMALGTQKHLVYYIPNWNKPKINSLNYGFPDGCFYELDERIRHLYSVQPCIWKKSSLIELLTFNPNITLHQLDNTDILNKKGERRNLDEFYNYSFYEEKPNFFDYGFKNFCYHYPPESYHIDEKPLNSEYFLIDYVEIVRNGKFLNANVNAKLILEEVYKTEEFISIKEDLTKFINF